MHKFVQYAKFAAAGATKVAKKPTSDLLLSALIKPKTL